MRIGYGRVSTRDQNPEVQHDALLAAGCDQVFLDKASGKLARRPQLDNALRAANRAGDQLVITKLDRLGRSLANLIDLSGQLHTRGVDLVVLDQGIDTSTAAGRMFFQMLGSIAEFEGALASERTLDGLAAARRRGRIGGRKPKLSVSWISSSTPTSSTPTGSSTSRCPRSSRPCPTGTVGCASTDRLWRRWNGPGFGIVPRRVGLGSS